MKRLVKIAALIICLFSASNALAVNVTLGDSQLMLLDFYSSPSLTPQVIDKRPVGGGVEFDILFPGNEGLDSQLLYSSSIFGGSGLLVENDLSAFDFFTLDFSYISILGIEPQASEGLELWVAPFVNDGQDLKYFTAELIGLAEGNQKNATALMDLSLLASKNGPPGDNILEIGFDVHMDFPDFWSPDGTVVTLLISPTAGAEVIPEPATIITLAFGYICLIHRRK